MTHNTRALRIIGGAAALCLCSMAIGGSPMAHAEAAVRERAAEVRLAQDAPASQNQVQKADQHLERYQLSQERYKKAVAYSRAEYRLYFLSVAWGITALLGLLQFGIVAKWRNLAERLSRRRTVQAVVFVPGLLLTLAVLHLPIRIWYHVLSLRYEQSVQGWKSWLWDWTKGEAIALVLGIVVALILMTIIRWKPTTWWLYFWYATVPLAAFLLFISPWFVDPMFYTFRPLQEQQPRLVESIGKLTRRVGMDIPPKKIFLMKASVKTNQINAYVTGIGASKRVVIWDTSIQKAQPDELLFIVGHEFGHYVLGHIWKGFVFFLGGMLAGLYAAYLALQYVLKRWGSRWGVRGQGDWASLGALLLIMSVWEFVGTPIGNGFSRMQEHEADQFGLEVIHGIVPDSQDVAAQAFQVMGDLDLADPQPSRFITIWLYSHPPIGERKEFAYTYDPWSKGEQPRFVK